MNPFASLQDISFADTNAESVQASVISAFETISKRTLYPGNPERLFLESLAYLLSVQNQVIDAAGKQNLLAYADGSHLDHLGVQHDTPRLGVTPATTTLRFAMPEVLGWNVEILTGTRVGTADKTAVFTTDADAVIETGQLHVDVKATATEHGAYANGLVTGQINTLIDPLAYISKVHNTTITLSGSDSERDDPYRSRIHESREAYSCAGPTGAYRYHAMRVHPDIAGVAIWIPTPGTVEIRPIMKDGELPDEDIIRRVQEFLSADDVRPLTDTVIVAAPELVEYSIIGKWYMSQRDIALKGSIGATVSRAVEAYRIWQRTMPGRDINPDELQKLIIMAGAKRIELANPVFTVLEPYQIGREIEINFTFAGVEDE